MEAKARSVDGWSRRPHFSPRQLLTAEQLNGVLKDELLRSLAGIAPREARLPLYSTVTATQMSGAEWDGGYWWRNVRDAVQFAPAIERLLEDGYDTFVELSPHAVLSSYLDEIVRSRGKRATIVHSLRRGAAALESGPPRLDAALRCTGGSPRRRDRQLRQLRLHPRAVSRRAGM